MRTGMIFVVLLLACCHLPERSLPSGQQTGRVTFELIVPDPTLEADLDKALVGWASIGLVRVKTGGQISAVLVERVAQTPKNAGGVTNRLERRIQIRADLTGFGLWVALAHEVGHAVLDTSTHTACGIMSGQDFMPCAEDKALACRRVGLGCR
jgi:hypothetical protein